MALRGFIRSKYNLASLPLKALTVLVLGLGSCFVLLILLMSFANLSVLLTFSEQTSRNQTVLVAGQLGRFKAQDDVALLARIMDSFTSTVQYGNFVGSKPQLAQVFDIKDLRTLASWPASESGLDREGIKDLAHRAIETSSVQQVRQGDVLIVAAPVYGEQLGPALKAISIMWDQAQLRPQLLKSTIAQGTLGLASALASIFALGSVIRRIALRPITVLAEVVERILADGDTMNIPSHMLNRHDEIGRLATSFQMILMASNEQLTRRRKQLDAALEHMSQGLTIFDRHHQLSVCNRRFIEIYGLAEDSTKPGVHLWEVLDAFKAAGNHTDNQLAMIMADLAKQMKTMQPMIYLDHLVDGRVISVERVLLPDGGWLTTFADITQRRQMEMQLAHMAHHDTLTGLPNRAMFRQELESALAGASHRNQLALLYLDLDGFKRVNDSLGHPVGDELLKAVTRRLRACLRPTALVARLGGDEFAIIEHNFNDLTYPGVLADRIIKALGQPYEIAGHCVSTGTSIGIALAPYSGRNPDALVEAADRALYRAKTDGRACYRYCEQKSECAVPRPERLDVEFRTMSAG